MQTMDSFNFSGKKALTRVDFNVPLNEQFEITDDTRIQAALPTVKKILSDGGSAILMSHLGRPKGREEKFSLKHLVSHLEGLLKTNVHFASDCLGSEAEEKAGQLKSGEVLLLENLRFHEGEKKGSDQMAEQLSKLGDVYVNDAFGTAHRAHASTAIIAKYFDDKLFGYLMDRELKSVAKVMKEPKKPFTAVIGGAKVSSKIGIIENLMNRVDNLIIGGGMAYTFAVAQGGNVGNSLVEKDYVNTAKKILDLADEKGVRIIIPEDTVAGDDFSNDANKKTVPTSNIPDGFMGLDIGPEAIEDCKLCLEESKTILWNGPMGVFEFENFSEGTKQVAYAIVTASERGAFSLVGGGDSVAAVNKFKLKEHVSYVSTGGGALLELIEGKELPGVKAIKG
ncbi:phosphoglycerate kinase [Salibacter sp.]|uniref:phosphoglycerate kinase n=1 Tax=Salibacter sp. TaxID=2010995 RepID=UPI0028701853|nr:phosphoglycerate kinase [Salibacter sp.]MDR9398128.1 phosphoglycerate kinase [Salibacter sp.]MDR9487558.1 phosphoglycerate kinase [Salibacter sp.]